MDIGPSFLLNFRKVLAIGGAKLLLDGQYRCEHDEYRCEYDSTFEIAFGFLE